MLTLYTTPLSANGRKPLAVARQLGLAPAVRTVDVYRGEGRAPDYLALNPSGQVPTLVDGDLVLWESNAICIYLCEAYGEHRLWGRSAERRAEVARWLFWEASQWQPALVPVLEATVAHALLPDAALAPPGPPDWSDPRLRPLLVLLERQLGASPWLAGDALSLADFCVAGMATYFRHAGFPFDAWPALAAWYGRLESLESWFASATAPWG